MRIAVYSGSFNPLHIGHQAIMEYLTKDAAFDWVYLVVSPQSPFKGAENVLTGEERYEAAVAAVKRHPEIRVWVDDIELGMEPPHYTIRTLDALPEGAAHARVPGLPHRTAESAPHRHFFHRDPRRPRRRTRHVQIPDVMNIETERKFLVLNDDYQAQAVKSYRIRQGYLAHDSGRSVRVRIRDDQGFLTIKGPSIILGSRPEWEKEISLQEAEDLFALCKPGSVDKTRWIVPAEMPGQAGHDGRYFEVDEFHGENEGLVMAEIELESPDEPFERPSWLGREVTEDKRYYNGYLATHPFKTW